MADPTPKATANAPTRPTDRADETAPESATTGRQNLALLIRRRAERDDCTDMTPPMRNAAPEKAALKKRP